jgi:hypothetical protein
MQESSGKSVNKAAFIATCTLSPETLEKSVTTKFSKAVSLAATRSGDFSRIQTQRFVGYASTYARSLVSRGIYMTDKEIAKDAKLMIQTAQEYKSYFTGFELEKRVVVDLLEFKESIHENGGLPEATREYLKESFPAPARKSQTSPSDFTHRSSSGLDWMVGGGGYSGLDNRQS